MPPARRIQPFFRKRKLISTVRIRQRTDHRRGFMLPGTVFLPFDEPQYSPYRRFRTGKPSSAGGATSWIYQVVQEGRGLRLLVRGCHRSLFTIPITARDRLEFHPRLRISFQRSGLPRTFHQACSIPQGEICRHIRRSRNRQTCPLFMALSHQTARSDPLR